MRFTDPKLPALRSFGSCFFSVYTLPMLDSVFISKFRKYIVCFPAAAAIVRNCQYFVTYFLTSQIISTTNFCLVLKGKIRKKQNSNSIMTYQLKLLCYVQLIVFGTDIFLVCLTLFKTQLTSLLLLFRCLVINHVQVQTQSRVRAS